MKEFIDYLDKNLPDKKDDKILYLFKRKTLDEMNEELKDAKSRGINNDKVFVDLVISNHGNLIKDYEAFYKAETASNKRKRSLKLNVIGSAVYLVVLVAFYLAVSFITSSWNTTWLIITSGVLFWVSYIFLTFGKMISELRRIFHIFARVLFAMAAMTTSVGIFLISMGYFHVPKSWLIIIAGVASVFVCDGIFITLKKQKLATLSYLIYIPAFFTMLFIIFGGAGLISWNIGWLLIIAGLLIDVAFIAARLMINKKYKLEVYDQWSEN